MKEGKKKTKEVEERGGRKGGRKVENKVKEGR